MILIYKKKEIKKDGKINLIKEAFEQYTILKMELIYEELTLLREFLFFN
jgi:hypothetical protein